MLKQHLNNSLNRAPRNPASPTLSPPPVSRPDQQLLLFQQLPAQASYTAANHCHRCLYYSLSCLPFHQHPWLGSRSFISHNPNSLSFIMAVPGQPARKTSLLRLIVNPDSCQSSLLLLSERSRAGQPAHASHSSAVAGIIAQADRMASGLAVTAAGRWRWQPGLQGGYKEGLCL